MTEKDGTEAYPGLPALKKPNNTWRCRVCAYVPIPSNTRFCPSCGRDWFGFPGTVPSDEEKPARPGLRAAEYQGD